jgi:hypothetical protein
MRQRPPLPPEVSARRRAPAWQAALERLRRADAVGPPSPPSPRDDIHPDRTRASQAAVAVDAGARGGV